MSEANMTGYQTARAISHHFGITISNDDAIKLDRALRATVYHAMEQARREEREACALIGDGFHDDEANCGDLIRARGANA